MKPSTRDQAEGKFHEVKGTIKKKAGKAINLEDQFLTKLCLSRPGFSIDSESIERKSLTQGAVIP